MRINKLSKINRLIIMASGLLFLASLFLIMISGLFNLADILRPQIGQSKSNYDEYLGAVKLPKKFAPGLPVRLVIPVLDINTAIEHVGMTTSGLMDVPKDIHNVAWFELGQRPGEIGTAVIDGHSGTIDKKALIFDNLDKLKQGDKLLVEDDKGNVVSFVVSERRIYKPQDNALDVFYSDNKKARLNLITCDGVWNNNLKSYSERLVIFADREE